LAGPTEKKEGACKEAKSRECKSSPSGKRRKPIPCPAQKHRVSEGAKRTRQAGKKEHLPAADRENIHEPISTRKYSKADAQDDCRWQDPSISLNVSYK
jgi:hypothetical protein